MTTGSLNLSRTVLSGRKYAARPTLTHDAVRAISARNFQEAAELIVDHHDTLPLGLETALQLNKILVKGLVPEHTVGNVLYHGDEDSRREVQQFYDFIASPRLAELAAEFPVEVAEKFHFIISHLDAAVDSNGRAARLMADLVLVKAGFAPALYSRIDDYFRRGSVRSGVTLEQRHHYFRNVVARGQETMASLVSMRESASTLRGIDPAVIIKIKTTPGHESIPIAPEPRGSSVEFLQKMRAQEERLRKESSAPASVTQRLKNGLAQFSGSYWRLVAGIGLLEGISIAMAATMAIFGISQFGLAWGIAATSLSTITRIPGGKVAAWLKKKQINPKQIYSASIFFNFAQIAILPLGLALFGQSAAYLAVFMASQAIYGFVWGATQGVAEASIMPKVVGDDQRTLSTAKLMLMTAKTLTSLVFAFAVGPILTAVVGLNSSIIVYAGMTLAALPLFASVKLLDSPAVTPAPAMAAPTTVIAATGKNRLPLSEALPYIATMFLVMSFYTVFVGNFSLFRFNDAAAGIATDHTRLMSLLAIGFYNLGGAVITMAAAIPQLLASLDGRTAPSSNSMSSGPASLKKWFGALAAATAFYLGTGMAGLQWLNVGVGATLLGVAAAINRSQWPAYYVSSNSGLDKKSLDNEMSRLIGWATKLTFVPFGILSIGKLLDYAVEPLLLTTAATAALIVAIAWIMVTRARKGS